MAGKCVYELFSTHSLRQRSHSNRRHSVADDSCCCCCNCEQNEKCLRMLIKSLLHLIRRRNYYSYAWLIFWGTAFGAKHFNTRNQLSNQSKLNGPLWALKNTDTFMFFSTSKWKKECASHGHWSLLFLTRISLLDFALIQVWLSWSLGVCVKNYFKERVV